MTIEEVIIEQAEFRTRVEKSAFKDKIYLGVFRKTLWDSSIGESEIKKALRNKEIAEVRIAPLGQTERVGYVWLGKECRQVSPLKKVVALVPTLFADLPDFFSRLKGRVRRFLRTWLWPRF